MSTVPSGEWYCPGCDVLFANSVEELRDDETVLSYHPGDPYLDNVLLTFVRSGHKEATLAALAVGSEQRPARLKGQRLRVHPKLPDWLVVCK
jgi:hypothetical protein